MDQKIIDVCVGEGIGSVIEDASCFLLSGDMEQKYDMSGL
jgi:hypothetical protein